MSTVQQRRFAEDVSTSKSATATKRARVILADDHTMLRQGIRDRLMKESDIDVVGEAESRDEVIALVDRLEPDVVVLDIRLGHDSGIEVTKSLRVTHPNVKVLILSAFDYEQYVRALVRVGVAGYITKEHSQDGLVQAIRTVMAGGASLDPKIAVALMGVAAEQPTPARTYQAEDLTLREVEVLELVREGMRNHQIADYLTIAPRTVESHVNKVLGKLGVSSRTEAVRAAQERGILD